MAIARPVGKTVKFISFNSTGLGPVKTQWIRNLMDTVDAQFCGLQEHFKKTKTLSRHFRAEFPKFDNFAVPAHREDGRDTGRAKGGLAQLAVKGLKLRKQHVVTGGWRIQAQIVHFGDWRLLWINVYFPTDSRIVNFDEEELLAVQAELEEVLEKGGYDGCVAGGDWNYDARRTSGFARSMASFLERVGLVSVWEKFPIDFTYMHTDNKSCSILDNFYVNSALLPFIEDAGPLHLGDNPSNHSPIMMVLRVGDIPKPEVEEEVRVPRRLAWDKAKEEEVKRFTSTLQESLEGVEEPQCLACSDVQCTREEHSLKRDQFLIDVMSAWIEAGYKNIPQVQSKSGEGAKRSRQLPGWKENCEPLAKDSKFWYSVWVSAGRPTSGELHRIMVRCRVKFRAAVRRARGQLNSQRGVVLLHAADSGDKALLREMRKVIGPKKDVQTLPDSLEGAVGHVAILQKFQDLYATLYSSAGTGQLLEELKAKVGSSIDCRDENEVRKITGEAVRIAATRMKPGKIDVHQSYASDVFQHAPPILFDKLAAVFRSFLVHGSITLSVLTCSFMPLLKSARKDPAQFDSYRAVAGASQLLKLFEYCILNVWGKHLDSDSLQFGFKQGTGTTQCTWLLVSVAEFYLLRGSPTLCCLLDVKKGFPSVKFASLFEICYEEKKLPAIVCRVLMFMYQEQKGYIRVRGRQSSPFNILNGMREGAAASPVLWNVYANGILVKLRKSGLGCYVAGKWMGAVMYADDLALLAPTRAILASMLSLVVAHGATLNLTFSSCQEPKKCKSFCLFFTGVANAKKVKYPAPLVLNGVKLPWREQAVHLGHKLGQDLTMSSDVKEKRARFIARSVEVREQFSFAAPPQILRAVRILACDAYGAVLWRLDSPSVSSFFSAYTSCIKRIWRLPLNTHTFLVEGHLTSGVPTLRNMVISRVPGFYQKLLRSPSEEVSLMAEIAAKDARTVLAGNLAFVSNLSRLDMEVATSRMVREALPVAEVQESEFWRLGLLDILLRNRADLEREGSDTKSVCAMISSLCAT